MTQTFVDNENDPRGYSKLASWASLFQDLCDNYLVTVCPWSQLIQPFGSWVDEIYAEAAQLNKESRME